MEMLMDTTLLKQVTADAVNNEIFRNWITYAILFGFTLLSAWITNYFGSYLKKRADVHATKTDMDEVLRQLRETTAAAQEVKSSIEQSDWAAREWNTLRRKKLEELLDLAHSLDDVMHHHSNAVTLSKGELPSTAVIDKLQTLSTLYFPEIQLITWKMCQNYRKTVTFHFEARARVQAADRGDITVLQQALKQLAIEMKPFQTANVESVSELRDAAAALMAKICQVPLEPPTIPPGMIAGQTQQPHGARNLPQVSTP